MTRRTGYPFVLALAVAFCDSPSDTTLTPGIEIIAGAGVTDTVSATPVQALVVRIADAAGEPQADVLVQFQALENPCPSDPGSDCATMRAGVETSTGPIAGTTVFVRTDASGRAVARIGMGTVAGDGGIVIIVPELGLADTATYTILPGAPAAVAFPASLIGVGTGESIAASASVVDRYGNPLPGAITYQEVVDGPFTITPSGMIVAGQEVGSGTIRATSVATEAMSAVTTVTVVPAARIAMSALHGPIRLTTLAGTEERVLMMGNVNAQDWSPDGGSLVYVDDRGDFEYALSVMDTLGNTTMLPVPLRSTWPQYSRDGQWIYFFTQTALPNVMRIRPNGTALQTLRDGAFPAPSPDGSRIAMMVSGSVWVGDLATMDGAAVPNSSNGFALRWSPDGEWLAYRVPGGIEVIRPNGTDKRLYAAGSTGGIAWSPDSRWILSGGNVVRLIDTENGAIHTLPVTGLYPAWKPVP